MWRNWLDGSRDMYLARRAPARRSARRRNSAWVPVVLLVGAGRFERPTACAQGIGTCAVQRFVSFVFSMPLRRIVYSQDGAL